MHSFRPVSFFATATVLGLSTTVVPLTAQAVDSSAYKAQAEEILKMADSAKPDEKKIGESAKHLLALGRPIVVAFSKKFPECSAYLDATLKATARMTTLTIPEIEADYHEDGLLPKAPSKCKNPKDLLVHPATAVIYSKSKLTKDTTENLKRELEEVLGHLEAVNEIL